MEHTCVTILAAATAAYAGRFCFRICRAFKAEAGAGTGNGIPKDYPQGFGTRMTKKEAAQILGISENDAKDKIKEAHKRLIVKNHPDAGGSVYLAAKINHAKDTLMKNTKRHQF
ncbi:hypothetical protein QVD17_11579 [Tagetes erecta]|uniref:J domain-containing protein n=1 Tax=Tagetes erecta TaxID=13708 RepID=A0AAD8KY88_TARER|nr:hypothetical protein QVD17_11579 [Tagetes erecta]